MDKQYYDKHGGSVDVGGSKYLYIEARVVASAIVGAIREALFSFQKISHATVLTFDHSLGV